MVGNGVRLADVAMRGQAQAHRPRLSVHGRKLLRKAVDLGIVEADADELVAPRRAVAQHLQRVLGRAVAQEAHDVAHRKAERLRRFEPRLREAAEDRRQRHAAFQVQLRVEEHLGVDHALRLRPGVEGHRQIAEVARRADRADQLLVDADEARQIARVAQALAHRLGVGVRRGEAVARRHRQIQLGLHRAFEMHVQLGFRQPHHEAPQFGARIGRAHRRLTRAAGTAGNACR
nr:hypothetical protein [Solimonas variicoloris]